MSKKIKNLVIYKSYDKNNAEEITKAKIFYEDGDSKVTSIEEGSLELFAYRDKEKLTSIDLAQKVHFLTEDELISNQKKFENKNDISLEKIEKTLENNLNEIISEDEIENTVKEGLEDISNNESIPLFEEEPEDFYKEEKKSKNLKNAIKDRFTSTINTNLLNKLSTNNKKENNTVKINSKDTNTSKGSNTVYFDLNQDISDQSSNNKSSEITIPQSLEDKISLDKEKYADAFNASNNEKRNKKLIQIDNFKSKISNILDKRKPIADNIKNIFSTESTTNNMDDQNYENIDNIDYGVKITNSEEEVVKKLSKNSAATKLRIQTAAIGLALGLGVGAVIGGLNSMINELFSNKKEGPKNSKNKITVQVKEKETTTSLDDKKIVELAKNKNFPDLLNLSKTSTNAQKDEMNNIGLFLTFYNGALANKIKSNHIRPALKWDEVVALKLGFNDYGKKSEEIFNGAKLEENDIEKNYNNAIKQLTKTFILEEKNSPVSLDMIINSPTGKKNYSKIDRYFQIAKANNNLNNINKFYNEVLKIISKNKTKDKSYNRALEPIVKAANKLFKNKKIDRKNYNKVNNYFNNSSYSKKRDNKFKNIEKTLAKARVNEDIPLYDQFRKAKIKQLKNNGWYSIKKRDLINSKKYKNIIDSQKNDNSKTDYSNDDYNTTNNYKSNHNYNEEKEVAIKIQKETTTKKSEDTSKHKDKQNKTNTTKKNNVKEKNKSTDKKENKNEKEIKEITKLNEQARKEAYEQARIDEYNIQKEETEKTARDIEENNYSYTTSSSSIKNNSITTDNTNATDELPDPNETGKKFDNNSVSDEELADRIVESMANTTYTEEETSYQYTYTNR